MRRKKVSKDKEVRKHENINKRFTYIQKKKHVYILYKKAARRNYAFTGRRRKHNFFNSWCVVLEKIN
jgi:hypothetical protein